MHFYPSAIGLRRTKAYLRAGMAIVAVLGSYLIVAAAPTAEDLAEPATGPRLVLSSYGIGNDLFDSFADDAPVSPEEEQLLLRLVFRVQRFTRVELARWSQEMNKLNVAGTSPRAARGQFFRLSGRVTRASEELVDAETLKRFQLEHCYRLQMRIADDLRAIILVPHVPSAWKLDQAIDEPAVVEAMFIKRSTIEELSPRGDGPQLPPNVFIAQRPEWRPDTLLGQLGMDVGLLDDVVDRKGLGAIEREAFYQLLHAVGRSKPGQLESAAAERLREVRADIAKQLLESQPGTAERSLLASRDKRLGAGSFDVAPFFNQPEQERGNLVALTGEATRAIEVRVDDADVVARFGIRRYYEVEFFTADSQNNPLVAILAERPPELPLADDIRTPITLSGYFYKSWGYRNRKPGADGGVQLQLAPLIIARTARVSSAPNQFNPTSIVTYALLAAAAVGVSLWALRAMSARRRERHPFGAEFGSRRFSSGDASGPDLGPDFSRLP